MPWTNMNITCSFTNPSIYQYHFTLCQFSWLISFLDCDHLSWLWSVFLTVISCLECDQFSWLWSVFLTVISCLDCDHLSWLWSVFLTVISFLECDQLSWLWSFVLTVISFLEFDQFSWQWSVFLNVISVLECDQFSWMWSVFLIVISFLDCDHFIETTQNWFQMPQKSPKTFNFYWSENILLFFVHIVKVHIVKFLFILLDQNFFLPAVLQGLVCLAYTADIWYKLFDWLVEELGLVHVHRGKNRAWIIGEEVTN